MSDKTELKKTMFLFHQESNRLINSNWEDSPLPIQRFLEQCEADNVVNSYLKDCLNNHLPEEFDAAHEYDEVLRVYGASFGPFSTIPEEESAQVYLILKEVVARNTRGKSNLFYGYGNGSKKFADMYRGFLDDVARRLIGNIERCLTLKGFEEGLDDSPSVSFNAPVGNAQINQASGGSTVIANQTNGFQSDDLAGLIQAVLEAGNLLSDIQDNAEELKAQMESGRPKRGIVKGALGFLRGVNGGVQFSAAVANLVSFFAQSGLISA